TAKADGARGPATGLQDRARRAGEEARRVRGQQLNFPATKSLSALILRAERSEASRRMGRPHDSRRAPSGALLTMRPEMAHATGRTLVYFTCSSAKLDSIEAMPSSRVSLVLRKRS